MRGRSAADVELIRPLTPLPAIERRAVARIGERRPRETTRVSAEDVLDLARNGLRRGLPGKVNGQKNWPSGKKSVPDRWKSDFS